MVEVKSQRQVSVNKQIVESGPLQEFLRSTFESRARETLFIVVAGHLRYGDLIDVIDAAKGEA